MLYPARESLSSLDMMMQTARQPPCPQIQPSTMGLTQNTSVQRNFRFLTGIGLGSENIGRLRLVEAFRDLMR